MTLRLLVSILSTGFLSLAACGSAAPPAGSVAPPADAASGKPSSLASNASFQPAGSSGATTAAPTSAAGARRWNFDQDSIGGLPQDAQMFTGKWAVRAESDSPSLPNALCQTGSAEFPALALSDVTYTNLSMTTHFKPISGRTDQAAGLIFRIQDKDDYYIVRANALENNVIIFKYIRGSRSTVKEGSAKVVNGQWQELRAEIAGDRIQGFLNGQQVVEASDGTFKAAGRVGLWTKSDSVTCFDDVSVTGAD